jgi:hypothetical protein
VSVNVVAGANPFTPLTLPITTGGPGVVDGGVITLREIV